MSNPTHGSIQESLEVVWKAIHEWCETFEDHDITAKEDEANTKLAMNLIMDELGYIYDASGVIIRRNA